MKRIPALFIIFAVLGISATLVCAQTNAPRKKTVWVPPPMGSHLGGGFVETDEAVEKQAASKSGKENTPLGNAVANLDAKANTVVEGHALMPTAVSWQTKVPVEVLKKQRAASGLTYGQLLVANSLATGSGKSFDQILKLRAKTQDWSQLAENLHVSVKSIVARVKAADDSLKYSEARRKLRRDQSIDATDFQRGGRTRNPAGG